MAISTYGQLKTAVASWLHRTDLTTVIPDFVALAESAIRRDVRCQAMEQQATGALSAATLALPTRFAEARRVVLGDYLLEYVTPQVFWPIAESTTYNYTIIGDDFHFQQSTGSYEIEYYQWFAAFADDGDTNWLLTNHPEIYLFGTLAEAAIYIRADPSMYAARYGAAVQQIRSSENRKRFQGPLTVRAEVRA